MHPLRAALRFAPTRPILAFVITLALQLLFAVLADIFGDAVLVVKLLACAIAFAALLGLVRFEGSSLGSVGFRGNPFRSFALGLLAGCLLIAVVVGLLAVAGVYRVLDIRFSSAFLGWALVLLPASAAEEIVYRGILFRMAEEGWGSVGALIFSALVFGFIHAANPGATPFTSLAIGLEGGLLLGAVYMATRSLWAVMGLHFGWNLMTSVFGFSVSGVRNPGLLQSQTLGADLWTGGAFGPEAGLATLLVATGVGLGVLMLAARRGEVRSPNSARAALRA